MKFIDTKYTTCVQKKLSDIGLAAQYQVCDSQEYCFLSKEIIWMEVKYLLIKNDGIYSTIKDEKK